MQDKTKAILLIILVGIMILLYNIYKNATRSEYAQSHNCTWTIQGGNDICK